ncbi:MAG: transcriptional regulator [Glaciihabitans sp.]|nr:transcriptional regulator [Glaciihabitans sp.]
MPPASASARIPVEERLFSLVLALLATDTGLTKAEILSTVQGYRQRYTATGSNVSLERQFERDKDDIRELGVPLETIEPPNDTGNNQNLRYRIPRGDYELPADISFSAEETTLLNLAAMVWREGSLSGQSRRAILKLRSLGVTSDEPVLGYAPRLRVREPAFDPLSAALEKKVVVRFGYLKPGEADARVRTVAPIALIQHQGRWMLHGEDKDAGGTRNFLLRRIVMPITTTTTRFTPFGPEATARAMAELDQIWDERTGLVEVEANSDAATRLSKRRGTTVSGDGTLQLHFSDINLFADELAGYGPEVLVLSPPELREAVRSRLIRTAADHG